MKRTTQRVQISGDQLNSAYAYLRSFVSGNRGQSILSYARAQHELMTLGAAINLLAVLSKRPDLTIKIPKRSKLEEAAI